MTVLMPNANATVLRRVEGGFDDHGERVPEGFAEPPPMLPARIRQRADGGWAIGVDTRLWPVREGDFIVDEQGRAFLVQSSEKITNNVRDDVDWVRVDGLVRGVGGTTPGGEWFVGRQDPIPD